MRTQLDQFIDHLSNLGAQVRHLRPDSMHIYCFWLVGLQHRPVSPPRYHSGTGCVASGTGRRQPRRQGSWLRHRRSDALKAGPNGLSDPPASLAMPAVGRGDDRRCWVSSSNVCGGAAARKIVRGSAHGPALAGQPPRYQAAGVHHGLVPDCQTRQCTTHHHHRFLDSGSLAFWRWPALHLRRRCGT